MTMTMRRPIKGTTLVQDLQGYSFAGAEAGGGEEAPAPAAATAGRARRDGTNQDKVIRGIKSIR